MRPNTRVVLYASALFGFVWVLVMLGLMLLVDEMFL